MAQPNEPEHRPAGRSRWRIAVALALVVAVGLGSRSQHSALPAWFARNAGDALWTTSVYLALALALVRAPAARLLAVALLLSSAVELSQLWRVEWLEDLRSTLPGRLLLGRGWSWADLPRYAVGAALAWGIDRAGALSPGSRAAEA